MEFTFILTASLLLGMLIAFPDFRQQWFEVYEEERTEDGFLGRLLAGMIATVKAPVLTAISANNNKQVEQLLDPSDPRRRLPIALNSWLSAVQADIRQDEDFAKNVAYVTIKENFVVVGFLTLPNRHEMARLQDRATGYPIVEGFRLVKVSKPQQFTGAYEEVTWECRLLWQDIVMENRGKALAELGRQERSNKGR